MSHVPPLPFTAPLDAYDAQATALLEALRAGEPAAREAFKWEHPRFRDQPLSAVAASALGADDARLVVAHRYAFHAWADLSAHVDAVHRPGPVARFERAAEAVVSGDADVLRSLLEEHPALVHERSSRRHRATLLHYLAANGVEGVRQRTPPNAVEIATLLLDAGAEPDALADMYGQRCTTLSLLVSSTPPARAGLQAALAEVLLDRGAALAGPGTAWRSAVTTALTFGFPDTARMLAERVGTIEDLAVAAGLGLTDDVRGLLPAATADQRHRALALAAQLGRTEVVGLVLDAGDDPSRYNPEGLHAHATPLHQAVAGGHLDTVRLLVERGARLDVRDAIFEGTPLGWAEHLGRGAIAEYLRSTEPG